MKIGFHLTPFWSPTDRGATRIIDEAIEVVAAASRMGFAWVSIGQHWISHPTVWPQPFPMLARLAPETGQMRLKTSVLLLPIVNAVETAESIATLDHITHGRLDVGVAIGYRERELEAAGLARKDRVPKLEESLALMKRLWTGEEVTFHGAYTSVTKARLGFTPFQQPHPPLEMGAQSEGATRRAARLTDGVFFGPQVAWRDIGRLSKTFSEARAESGAVTPGSVGASRSLIVAADKTAAVAATPDKLWALLWDVPRMVECMPGCAEAKEVVPQQRYTARMIQKVGPIRLSVPLDVEITSSEPPRRLALQAKGRDPAIGAEISMQVTLEITDREGATVLAIVAEGRILGTLGSLGDGVIARKAGDMLDEFGVRLRKAAEG